MVPVKTSLGMIDLQPSPDLTPDLSPYITSSMRSRQGEWAEPLHTLLQCEGPESWHPHGHLYSGVGSALDPCPDRHGDLVGAGLVPEPAPPSRPTLLLRSVYALVYDLWFRGLA